MTQQVADDVPYLDIAAVKNDGKTLTFFAVNRHPDEAMTVDVSLAGFTPKAIVEHMTIAHPDLQAANTAKKPELVVPQEGEGRQRRGYGIAVQASSPVLPHDPSWDLIGPNRGRVAHLRHPALGGAPPKYYPHS